MYLRVWHSVQCVADVQFMELLLIILSCEWLILGASHVCLNYQSPFRQLNASFPIHFCVRPLPSARVILLSYSHILLTKQLHLNLL